MNHPNDRPGALQVAFWDLGVPDGASEISVYDKLARTLIDAGMDPASIEFITPPAPTLLKRTCSNDAEMAAPRS